VVVEWTIYRVREGMGGEFEARAEERLGVLKRARGFITQSLMRNADDPGEYRAEIRWVSREYRDRFLARHEADGKAFDEKLSKLLDAPATHCLLEPV
jgi:heme-degrading monooxygenase HmoA